MPDERGEQDRVPGGSVAIFEGQRIRRQWVEDRWLFSVIDVVGLLTESADPRKYWFDMKRYIQAEGFRELSEKIRQLRMEAADGKQRLTDCADAQTMLRIVQSIPSPKAEPVKHWLATVGAERVEELENPALAIDRARQYYLAQGYSAEWIDARMQGIVARDDLTAEWRARGAEEGREFATLTDTLHRGTFDITTADHKAVKALKKRDNLRDSMTPLELALTTLAELTATAIHQAHDSQGFIQLEGDACEAGDVAGAARRDIEARTEQPIMSRENYKTLTRPFQQPHLLGGEGDDSQS
jgi:hypothetical protein